MLMFSAECTGIEHLSSVLHAEEDALRPMAAAASNNVKIIKLKEGIGYEVEDLPPDVINRLPRIMERGKRIAAVRIARGRRTVDVRGETGISSGGYSEIESSEGVPTPKYLYRICKVFKIDPIWIIDGRSWDEVKDKLKDYEKMYRLRLRKGKTQKEIVIALKDAGLTFDSDNLDAQRSTYSNWENAKAKPLHGDKVVVAKVLGDDTLFELPDEFKGDIELKIMPGVPIHSKISLGLAFRWKEMQGCTIEEVAEKIGVVKESVKAFIKKYGGEKVTEFYGIDLRKKAARIHGKVEKKRVKKKRKKVAVAEDFLAGLVRDLKHLKQDEFGFYLKLLLDLIKKGRRQDREELIASYFNKKVPTGEDIGRLCSSLTALLEFSSSSSNKVRINLAVIHALTQLRAEYKTLSAAKKMLEFIGCKSKYRKAIESAGIKFFKSIPDELVFFYDKKKQKKGESKLLTDLSLYNYNIENLPILSHLGEIKLGVLMQFKDKGAKKQLMTCNLRLLTSIAREYLWSGFSIIDLTSAGYEGLDKAADMWEARRGDRFSTYATHWIKHRIRRHIGTQRAWIEIPYDIGVEIMAYENKCREVNIEPADEDLDSSVITGAIRMDVKEVDKIRQEISKMSSLQSRKYIDFGDVRIDFTYEDYLIFEKRCKEKEIDPEDRDIDSLQIAEAIDMDVEVVEDIRNEIFKTLLRESADFSDDRVDIIKDDIAVEKGLIVYNNNIKDLEYAEMFKIIIKHTEKELRGRWRHTANLEKRLEIFWRRFFFRLTGFKPEAKENMGRFYGYSKTIIKHTEKEGIEVLREAIESLDPENDKYFEKLVYFAHKNWNPFELNKLLEEARAELEKEAEAAKGEFDVLVKRLEVPAVEPVVAAEVPEAPAEEAEETVPVEAKEGMEVPAETEAEKVEMEEPAYEKSSILQRAEKLKPILAEHSELDTPEKLLSYLDENEPDILKEVPEDRRIGLLRDFLFFGYEIIPLPKELLERLPGMTIGERIAATREARGIKPEDVCAWTGIPANTYSKIEKLKDTIHPTHIRNLFKVVRILNVDIIFVIKDRSWNEIYDDLEDNEKVLFSRLRRCWRQEDLVIKLQDAGLEFKTDKMPAKVRLISKWEKGAIPKTEASHKIIRRVLGDDTLYRKADEAIAEKAEPGAPMLDEPEVSAEKLSKMVEYVEELFTIVEGTGDPFPVSRDKRGGLEKLFALGDHKEDKEYYFVLYFAYDVYERLRSPVENLKADGDDVDEAIGLLDGILASKYSKIEDRLSKDPVPEELEDVRRLWQATVYLRKILKLLSSTPLGEQDGEVKSSSAGRTGPQPALSGERAKGDGKEPKAEEIEVSPLPEKAGKMNRDQWIAYLKELVAKLKRLRPDAPATVANLASVSGGKVTAAEIYRAIYKYKTLPKKVEMAVRKKKKTRRRAEWVTYLKRLVAKLKILKRGTPATAKNLADVSGGEVTAENIKDALKTHKIPPEEVGILVKEKKKDGTKEQWIDYLKGLVAELKRRKPDAPATARNLADVFDGEATREEITHAMDAHSISYEEVGMVRQKDVSKTRDEWRFYLEELIRKLKPGTPRTLKNLAEVSDGEVTAGKMRRALHTHNLLYQEAGIIKEKEVYETEPLSDELLKQLPEMGYGGRIASIRRERGREPGFVYKEAGILHSTYLDIEERDDIPVPGDLLNISKVLTVDPILIIEGIAWDKIPADFKDNQKMCLDKQRAGWAETEFIIRLEKAGLKFDADNTESKLSLLNDWERGKKTPGLEQQEIIKTVLADSTLYKKGESPKWLPGARISKTHRAFAENSEKIKGLTIEQISEELNISIEGIRSFLNNNKDKDAIGFYEIKVPVETGRPKGEKPQAGLEPLAEEEPLSPARPKKKTPPPTDMDLSIYYGAVEEAKVILEMLELPEGKALADELDIKTVSDELKPLRDDPGLLDMVEDMLVDLGFIKKGELGSIIAELRSFERTDLPGLDKPPGIIKIQRTEKAIAGSA